MISVDIETSGLEPGTHGMLSLGAVHVESGQEFYGENCVMPNVILSPKALEVNGFTEREARDTSKITPKQNLLAFVNWSKQFEDLTLMGWNFPSFDLKFMKYYFNELKREGLKWPYGHRYVDLHSQVQLVTGGSMGAASACEHFDIEKESQPHNALEGAKQNVRLYNCLKDLTRDHGYSSGNYILTNAGNELHFDNPLPEQISIDDIAHGLSHTCRFAGQINQYYSVAQHSVAVASMVKKHGGNDREVMQGILHDSAEAFLCDVPSPAKELMPDYTRLENHLIQAIGDKFNIDLNNLSPLVKKCDEQMLFHEAKHLFDDGLVDWAPEPEEDEAEMFVNKKGQLMLLPPRYAKKTFLQEFQLIQEMVTL